MKTTKFLTLAFAALFLSAAFVACDKDDDDNKQKEETVVPGNPDENNGNSGDNAETPDNNGDSENGNSGNESSGEGSTETTAPTKGIENGHEWVDLGLSVRWATCNIGASSPEKYGDYFAWGEIEPKEIYSDYTKHGKSDFDGLTKYCTDSRFGKDGFTDGKTILDAEDDAAVAKWKGSWRIPTRDEQKELLEKCNWEWVTQNSVEGYIVTSKVHGNDNSIFLPAAGWRCEAGLNYVKRYCCYWSSLLDTTGNLPSLNANSLYVKNNDENVYSRMSRTKGLPIRPVCPK